MNVFRLSETNWWRANTGNVKSFIQIRDEKIRTHVDQRLEEGMLWPEPLVQLNPSFEPGAWIDDLVDSSVLHSECARVFRIKQDAQDSGRKMRMHKHQEEAARTGRRGESYVLTTGTGSGKSLSYIVPIVDHVLRRGSGRGIQAIVIYPMNALANSQHNELTKFLCHGYPEGRPPVSFALYTGQEDDAKREAILNNPPDILLTNYVMLELILTRPYERKLIQAARGLSFLVLDELHTYRGRQGADVAMLLRRVKNILEADKLQLVGTSATMAGGGTLDEQRKEVAAVATRLFGSTVHPQNVIGETLRRSTPLMNHNDPGFVELLKARLQNHAQAPPTAYNDFINDPLSIWIETTLGIQQEPGSGRLIRAKPRKLSGDEGVGAELSKLTGIEIGRCEQALQEGLLAGYASQNPETGFPAFAFRLHQFISKGDTVHASLQPESSRHVTTEEAEVCTRRKTATAFCFLSRSVVSVGRSISRGALSHYPSNWQATA